MTLVNSDEATIAERANRTDGNSSQDSRVDTWRGFVAVIVAVILLLGFGALVAFLVVQADYASEGTWSRFVYLFGAAEALVFTAVGWLFGREVNRQAAASADARAEEATAQARTDANIAGQEEAKARALKAAVIARAGQAGGTPGVEERSIGGGPAADDNAAARLRDLADFARMLYPEI